MANKLYMGNLSFSVSEQELTDLVSEFGEVRDCKIIRDRDTNRSKGFGFVEMESPEAAQEVIEKLDGSDFQGRPLRVSIAEDKPRTGGGGGGGRGGRPGGGGGGGRGGFGGGGNRGPRY